MSELLYLGTGLAALFHAVLFAEWARHIGKPSKRLRIWFIGVTVWVVGLIVAGITYGPLALAVEIGGMIGLCAYNLWHGLVTEAAEADKRWETEREAEWNRLQEELKRAEEDLGIRHIERRRTP